jgi:hypothetical protein
VEVGLAVLQIVDFGRAAAWGVPVWIAWLAVAHWVYRRRIPDLFVLAGGAFSAIVVATVFLAKQLLQGPGAAGAYLLIGGAVIGMSAAASFWLRRIALEKESP